MRAQSIIKNFVVAAWLGIIGCAASTTQVAGPFPQSVRRVAVFQPYQRGAADAATIEPGNRPDLPQRTVGDLVADQARIRLAQRGFQVVSPGIVKVATKDRAPASPEAAAQIARQANIDAAVLYIEIQRWQPMPYERGMKADGVIVALDATLIDAKSGAVLWQAHRPSRPVPVNGLVLTGQANVFVAETVARELFG